MSTVLLQNDIKKITDLISFDILDNIIKKYVTNGSQ